MKQPAPPEYELRLRALAGHWQAPPVQRLRALLKAALRGYGFRAVRCRPLGERPQGGQTATGPATPPEAETARADKAMP